MKTSIVLMALASAMTFSATLAAQGGQPQFRPQHLAPVDDQDLAAPNQQAQGFPPPPGPYQEDLLRADGRSDRYQSPVESGADFWGAGPSMGQAPSSQGHGFVPAPEVASGPSHQGGSGWGGPEPSPRYEPLSERPYSRGTSAAGRLPSFNWGPSTGGGYGYPNRGGDSFWAVPQGGYGYNPPIRGQEFWGPEPQGYRGGYAGPGYSRQSGSSWYFGGPDRFFGGGMMPFNQYSPGPGGFRF